jgi:hypothetical protein
MANNQFIYKPISESKGRLTVLAPSAFAGNIDQVEIVDADGNVIEQGNFRSLTNGNRPTFDFSRPGNAYANSQVRISFSNGVDPITIDTGSGGRIEQDFSDYATQFSSGASYSGNGTPTYSTPQSPSFSETGGVSHVNPQRYPFEDIPAPYVNFRDSLDLAQQVGAENRDIYFDNISRSRDAALGLVDTDLQGINRGLDQMIPRARREGDIDTATNIGRAGQIDQFNLSRLSRFNEFNAAEHANAVESSGLDYRGRIGGVLNRLEERATGNLPSDLAESLNTDLANRGSDLLAGSGISSVSGAGVRANDRLTISERLAMSAQADAQLPNVLLQGQQVLQAPTQYATPTDVPLNATNLGERIPLTSSISAGAAQQNLGAAATDLQVIPATGVLSSSLQTEQYNQTGLYTRNIGVGDRIQQQMIATDNAAQGALNTQRADQIRQENLDAYNDALDQRETSEWIQAGAGIISDFLEDSTPSAGEGTGGNMPKEGAINSGADLQAGGTSATAGGGGNSGRSATVTTSPAATRINSGSDIIQTVADGFMTAVDGTLDWVSGMVDTAVNQRTGNIKVGNAEMSATGFRDSFKEVANFFSGAAAKGSPAEYKGQQVIGGGMQDGQMEFYTENGDRVTQEELAKENPTFVEQFGQVFKPFADAGADFRTVAKTAADVTNWSNMSGAQQAAASANLGVDILENQGILSGEDGRSVRATSNAVSTLMDPNASNTEKAGALAIAGGELAMDSFTGDINAPTTIGGERVVRAAETDDKQPGFLLQSGRVVAQDTLVNTASTMNALNAFYVVNGQASTENKLAALTGLGIKESAARDIISQTNAGNANAALSIFGMVNNWDRMNAVQRGVSVLQTTNAVMNSSIGASGIGVMKDGINTSLNYFSQEAANQTANQVGAQTAQTSGQLGTQTTTQSGTQAGSSGATSGLGNVVQGAAGAAAVAYGVHSLVQTGEAAQDMPKSQRGQNTLGQTTLAGAAIGGGAVALAASMGAAGSVVPGVGTAIGAAVGLAIGAVMMETGTGKGTGQIMRDGWRKGLKEGGVLDDGYNVTLADGTKYDMGRDGGDKLPNKGTNKDGNTERHTFDVDWSNELAVESIPDGHLFAIATGLDPTENEAHGLFQRGMAQGLNAATSNATSIDDVRANYRAMLKDVDPSVVANRVEELRISNKISEQEYGVYLDRTNKIFGTDFQPTDREQTRNAFVAQIEAIPEDKREKATQHLHSWLTNPKWISDSEEKLARRIRREKADLEVD